MARVRLAPSDATIAGMIRKHHTARHASGAGAALISMLALGTISQAQDSPTVARITTLTALFPADKAKSLAVTLPPDRPLRYRVRIPPGEGPKGVLVFVNSGESGEIPAKWTPQLDEQNLIWIAADDFGNARPSAQRILAAIAALRLIESTEPVDAKRLYIAGVSGGGRIASQIMTRFPQYFGGALFIVGADYWTSAEKPLLPRIVENRYVFITGSADFNQLSMQRMYSKYRQAGVTKSMLMDLPHFGHQFPNAEQLGKAIDFLDAR
jgi:predicted esterase